MQHSIQVDAIDSLEKSATRKCHFKHHHLTSGHDYPHHLPQCMDFIRYIPDAKGHSSNIETIAREGELEGVAPDQSYSIRQPLFFNLYPTKIQHFLNKVQTCYLYVWKPVGDIDSQVRGADSYIQKTVSPKEVHFPGGGSAPSNIPSQAEEMV